MSRAAPQSDPFRTIVPAPSIPRPLGIGEPVLSLGSCFAEVIGERLSSHCLSCITNPFGPLYNPAAIARALQRMLDARRWSKRELIEHEGLWRSFDAHAALGAPTASQALRRLNGGLDQAVEQLSELTMLLVTFGTAWVWQLRDTKQVVANCHRLPPERFNRRLLSIEEIVAEWTPLLEGIHARLPRARVVLTVSPVRHLRNDPHENSISKAHLLAAVNELQNRFASLHYFPAYEIVLDELRDYRFFARDRAHLTEEAEEYVWQRFVQSALDNKARALVEAVAPLLAAAAHRVSSHTDAAKRFAESQLERVARIEREFPGACCDQLRQTFVSLLADRSR
jgi:hypothetical protein